MAQAVVLHQPFFSQLLELIWDLCGSWSCGYCVAWHGIESIILVCGWIEGKEPEVCLWIINERDEVFAYPYSWFCGIELDLCGWIEGKEPEVCLWIINERDEVFAYPYSWFCGIELDLVSFVRCLPY